MDFTFPIINYASGAYGLGSGDKMMGEKAQISFPSPGKDDHATLPIPCLSLQISKMEDAGVLEEELEK